MKMVRLSDGNRKEQSSQRRILGALEYCLVKLRERDAGPEAILFMESSREFIRLLHGIYGGEVEEFPRYVQYTQAMVFLAVLRHLEGNKSDTAKILGISRNSLLDRLKSIARTPDLMVIAEKVGCEEYLTAWAPKTAKKVEVRKLPMFKGVEIRNEF